MKKLNESINHPLRFVSKQHKEVIGQFYNSIDKKFHLASYVPYEITPYRYLCGEKGNFSPNRRDDPDMNKCEACLEKSLTLGLDW